MTAGDGIAALDYSHTPTCENQYDTDPCGVPAWWWVKGGEYGNYLCDDCAEALGYVFAGRLVEL